jgi:hypothetical protein
MNHLPGLMLCRWVSFPTFQRKSRVKTTHPRRPEPSSNQLRTQRLAQTTYHYAPDSTHITRLPPPHPLSCLNVMSGSNQQEVTLLLYECKLFSNKRDLRFVDMFIMCACSRRPAPVSERHLYQDAFPGCLISGRDVF